MRHGCLSGRCVCHARSPFWSSARRWRWQGGYVQSIFENPLAEPSLLGVYNGAVMTLTLAVPLGCGRLPVWMLGLSAVAGALLMSLAALAFARRQTSNARLLLTGVALKIL